MIVKLDYNDTLDRFINNPEDKMLGRLYVAIDERRNNPDFNMSDRMINDLHEDARHNTEPMQDVLGIIINKPDFTYDNATVEDVKTLTDCIFEHGSPFVFKDDVDEQNYKMVLGYISGKLALDLAAKHYMFSDLEPTNQHHFPIGIVQAKTDEPLVFDSSDYAKKPERPSLNIFKYIFNSEYRQHYQILKSSYNNSLKHYEEMNNRTERTMESSADCSRKFRNHPTKDGKHLQTQTMKTAKLETLMLADSLDGVEEQLGTSANPRNNDNTRTLVEGGFNAFSKEESGYAQERKTQAVKNDPVKNKDMTMSN